MFIHWPNQGWTPEKRAHLILKEYVFFIIIIIIIIIILNWLNNYKGYYRKLNL